VLVEGRAELTPGGEERHTQQHFEIYGYRAMYEIYGYRAMYKDGWWLSQSIERIPRDATLETMKRFAPGCGSRTMTRRSCTTCLMTSARRACERWCAPVAVLPAVRR